MNEELQEREIQIQNQMKTKTFLFSFDVLNFPALDLIFLSHFADRREFQNNFSSSVPYHIQPCAEPSQILFKSKFEV